MRIVLWILISLNVSVSGYAQDLDSVSALRSTDSPGRFTMPHETGINNDHAFLIKTEKQKQLIVRGNITIVTYNLFLSPIENEIAELEAMECNAQLKRDTAALRKVWTSDFTLDEPQKELAAGKNPLPYYTSLTRIIERFTLNGETVFTSGYETVQSLQANGKTGDSEKRSFFHKWIRKNGTWKLSTNTHN